MDGNSTRPAWRLPKERANEIYRERIKDALATRGGNRSREAYLDARGIFLRRAVEVAERMEARGERVWSTNNQTMLEAADNSLSVLLKEKGQYKGSTYHTGYNERWVLRIWDETLESLIRGKFEEILDIQESLREQAARLNAEQRKHEEEQELVGVQVMAQEPRRISDRLLEAYVNRDGDGFMGLLLELEGAGR